MKGSSRLPALLLGLAALASLGISLAALFNPGLVASRGGLELASNLGRSEIMTFYGAFYFGMGLFLLVAAGRPELRLAAAMALTFTALPAALVRLLTILTFDLQGPEPWSLLAGESLYTAAGIVSWTLLRQPRRPSAKKNPKPTAPRRQAGQKTKK